MSMYDSQEITRISKNLSLRQSPERKYAPKYDASCPICCCCPCKCCPVCHNLPCRCCHICHCCPCTCIVHSPLRYRTYSPLRTESPNLNYLKKTYSPIRNFGNSSGYMGSTNFSTYHSPSRLRNPNNSNFNLNTNNYNYNEYEQRQFNNFLKKLMLIESQIEKIKIDLALNPDFNCEDAFRIFELDGRGYLDKDDLKYGLNLIGIFPTDQELRLLMKRFDLQKQGGINYADFFDIVVPFEKEYRTMVEERMPNSCCACRCLDVFSFNTVSTLKDLFNYIINSENEINDLRRNFGSLRLKLKDIFGLLDYLRRGYFTNSDLIVYLQKECLMGNNKDADLLFIRLDKNRNGKIDYREVEDEVQTLY